MWQREEDICVYKTPLPPTLFPPHATSSFKALAHRSLGPSVPTLLAICQTSILTLSIPLLVLSYLLP
jgi:hypothetical protein